MNDSFNLQRFLSAQEVCYERVRQELLAGKKQTHWMWFIFPQIAGLGKSDMAQRYAIRSLDEARAYLSHEILGERLLDCTLLACKHNDRSALQIFGSPDELKFHSSMTLFDLADPDYGEGDFNEALDLFFNGARDQATLQLV